VSEYASYDMEKAIDSWRDSCNLSRLILEAMDDAAHNEAYLNYAKLRPVQKPYLSR
jgi:hypothetical protein